ncbi:class I SAM-dependent methyltransferase [bacterium]|nr:class I SAM-dependent methyltransferase [bacterium]
MERTPEAFLQAKRQLDSRSHHVPTWQWFRAELATLQQSEPLQILEPGCGTGSLLEHLLALPELKHARIEAFDNDPDLIASARALLPERATAAGFSLNRNGEQYLLRQGERKIEIVYRTADIDHFSISSNQNHPYDILITHAFLDLFPIPVLVPDLLALLNSGGLFYALLTFDGGTRFLPELDRKLDDRVVELYQQSMVRRDKDGQVYWGFEAGRDLLRVLQDVNAKLLSSGDSDWNVDPGELLSETDYKVFLRTILDYVEREVAGNEDIDPKRFANWMRERRKQVTEKSLRFRAHNIDVLARV